MISYIYTHNSHIHIDLDGTNAGQAHTNEVSKSNSREIGGIFELGGHKGNRRISSP